MEVLIHLYKDFFYTCVHRVSFSALDCRILFIFTNNKHLYAPPPQKKMLVHCFIPDPMGGDVYLKGPVKKILFNDIAHSVPTWYA